MLRQTTHLVTLASLVWGAFGLTAVDAQAPRSPTPEPIAAPVSVVTVAEELERPWGLAFLPDGRILVTERPGRLRLVDRDGRLSDPLTGVPQVLAQGQGGLLDVALNPTFAQDRLVYLSFAEPGEGGAGTAVARGRLGTGGLEGTQVIWRQQPKVSGANHWGSRLVLESGRVMREERYLAGLGERIRDVVQGPDGLLYLATDNPRGRILRLVSTGGR